MAKSSSTDTHVVVLAFPFGAHASALLTITHHLATLAPATHFSFLSTPKSNDAVFSKFKTNAPRNVKACNVPDGVPDGYVFEGNNPLEEIELFLKAAPEVFLRGIKAAVAENGREVSCLVTDAFLWFAKEMAEEIGVPWVPFWAGGPMSLSAHLYTSQIRETIGLRGIAGREDEALEFITGMSKFRIRDLPEGVVFGDLESSFAQALHKMGIILPDAAAAVFINSFEELYIPATNDFKTKFKKFLNIGPLNLISESVSPSPPSPDESGCLSWLDKQNKASVAYISFGTVAAAPPEELLALAEALEAIKIPFLWSLKEHLKVHLPYGFLHKIEASAQGMIIPWAPQLEVLAHSAVGVFVTHCGWNSVLEGIGGGVPMIGRPFFGDHRLNGRILEDVLEIGEIVKDGILTKNGVLASFEMILLGEKGKKMRANIKALQQLAKKAVGPDGSSTQNFQLLLDFVTRPKGV